MPTLVRHRVHPRHEHLGAIYESGRGINLRGRFVKSNRGVQLPPVNAKGAGLSQPPSQNNLL
jgi:hypothetical protein